MFEETSSKKQMHKNKQKIMAIFMDNVHLPRGSSATTRRQLNQSKINF